MANELFQLDPGKFSYYLGVRRMSQVELARRTGISRTSINQYCNGVFKPRVETAILLAEALNVQLPDLEIKGENSETGKLIADLTELLNTCYPSVLENHYPYLAELLKHSDQYLTPILDFLMFRANTYGIVQMYRIRQMMETVPQMYQGYHSTIRVYYSCSEDEPEEYECLVKFEPWVYEAFGIEDDSQLISIHVEAEIDSEDWYGEVIDELQTTLLYDLRNEMEGCLADAFNELLDDADWTYPEEVVWEDYDPMEEMRVEWNTIRYKSLFERMTADGAGPELLARAVADEAFGREMFEKYEIDGKNAGEETLEETV